MHLSHSLLFPSREKQKYLVNQDLKKDAEEALIELDYRIRNQQKLTLKLVANYYEPVYADEGTGGAKSSWYKILQIENDNHIL